MQADSEADLQWHVAKDFMLARFHQRFGKHQLCNLPGAPANLSHNCSAVAHQCLLHVSPLRGPSMTLHSGFALPSALAAATGNMQFRHIIH